MNLRVLLRLTAGMFGVGAVLATVAGAATPDHWSLRRIVRPPLPACRGAVEHPIDRFVQASLDKSGLSPAAPADRATLARRLHFDLIGLPPTAAAVRRFVADTRPDAYERLVDKLLASPHYGERWARPWLDLCHYADSDGYLTDQLRPVAWRYRHWLVEALNRNLPFDQFTLHQLAGDLLAGGETFAGSSDPRLATGFLRQTLSNREGGADLEEFRVRQVIDRTNLIGTVWMGLTVGCAQCHDHKYDPLTQQEYYQLYACINNADEVNIDAPLPSERSDYLSALPRYWARRKRLLAQRQADLESLQRRWETRLLHAYHHPGEDHKWDRQWELLGLVWGGGLGEGQLEGTEIVKLPWSRRSRRQQADLLDYFLANDSRIDASRFKELQLDKLRGALQKCKSELEVTRAPVMRPTPTRRDTHLHERGDFRSPGERVHPAVPQWLPTLPASSEPARLRLARWLVSDRHPLTARVAVNRAWQSFFGRGLVETSEDFGGQGTPPSHPELLDWLAAAYRDGGWDTKRLHRLIVTSHAYRQSSRPRPELAIRDPHNRWLARQSSRRLTAEMVRDGGLAISGLLSRNIGGPSVRPPQPARVLEEAFGNHLWTVSEGADRYRRSVYTFVHRTAPYAQAVLFDAPNPNATCTRRPRTNTPLQALALLNDPQTVEWSAALARRVLAHSNNRDAQVDYAFQLCVGRRPQPAERSELRRFLREFRADDVKPASEPGGQDGVPTDSRRSLVAWTGLAGVLLNLHETITRD